MEVLTMETILENAVYEIDALHKALGEGLDTDEKSTVLHDLSFLYRRAAISELLSTCDSEGFRRYLGLSGEVRRDLLVLAQERVVRPWYCRASLVDPLFDAIASRNDDLARAIARLSPTEWFDGDEFEDDFYYARFLHIFLTEGRTARDQLAEVLESFRKALEGDDSARCSICQCFLELDEAGWRDSMQALLEERVATFEERRDQMVNDIVKERTEGGVFIEGLALLRIAESLRLPTDFEHVLLPIVCR